MPEMNDSGSNVSCATGGACRPAPRATRRRARATPGSGAEHERHGAAGSMSRVDVTPNAGTATANISTTEASPDQRGADQPDAR